MRAEASSASRSSAPSCSSTRWLSSGPSGARAAAFTGWLAVGQGRQLAFSFVVNGIGSEAEGHALEDRVAAALATYPEAPPPAALTGTLQ